MPRDDRTFITVHDGMPEHHKIEALSDKAFRTLVDLWCWCSRSRSDGHVPDAVWRKRATAKARAELLARGLAEPHEDGVMMHDYLEHQRSKAEIEELSRKRAEAGAKGGRAKANGLASAKQVPEQVLKQTGSKPVAETDTDSSSNEEEAADEPRRADVEAICTLLADRVAANTDKRPRITKDWRTEARRLLDLDERPQTQIEHVIRWATTDAFWKRNILSMPTLRKKYDGLLIAAREDWKRNNGGQPSPDGDINPDDILGRDAWQPPAPPEDIEPGTPAFIAWHREQRDQHKRDRLAEARAVLERRRGA